MSNSQASKTPRTPRQKNYKEKEVFHDDNLTVIESGLKRGNPQKPISEKDLKTIEELFKIGCTVDEIIAVTGIKGLKHKKEYLENVSKWREGFKVSLRRQRYKAIQRGDSRLLVHMSKIYLDKESEKDKEDREHQELNDFLQFRIIKETFKEQADFIQDKKKTVSAMCSRRAGKTEGVARKIILKLLEYKRQADRNSEVIYKAYIICKSFKQGYRLYFNLLESILKKLDLPYTSLKSDGEIQFGDNFNLQITITGSDTLDSVEKLRGNKFVLAIIDEAQSCKYLHYLVNDILRPALLDYIDSQLYVFGTPPRTPNTYFEKLYLNEKTSSHHWDLTKNVFLPNYETILDRIKEETGLDESSPLFRREYLGLLEYDSEALFFKVSDKNYYTDEDLYNFILENRGHLSLVGGIDYGYSDHDAIMIFLHSKKSKIKYVLYEFKENHLNIDEIVKQIQYACNLEWLDSKYKSHIPQKIRMYGDGGGLGSKINKQVADSIKRELTNKTDIVIETALKVHKQIALEQCQLDIESGNIKFRKGGIYDEELKSIVKKRDLEDNLINEIDDGAYHPDLNDCCLYSNRFKWVIEDKEIEKILNAEQKEAEYIASTDEIERRFFSNEKKEIRKNF